MIFRRAIAYFSFLLAAAASGRAAAAVAIDLRAVAQRDGERPARAGARQRARRLAVGRAILRLDREALLRRAAGRRCGILLRALLGLRRLGALRIVAAAADERELLAAREAAALAGALRA